MRSSSAASSSGRRTRGSFVRALGRRQQVGRVLGDVPVLAQTRKNARIDASLRATVAFAARRSDRACA